MKKFIVCFSIIAIICLISIVCGYFFINPNIYLKGNEYIKLEINDKYIDDGVSIKLLNIDMSNKYIKEGSVDTSKVGTYTIYYKTNIKYIKNNKKIKRVIEVVDSNLPSIVLQGEENITLMQGEEYKELGYSATDNYDGNITSNVVTNNNIDTSKVGTYYVTYKVKDSSGNESIKKRTITVKEKPKPVITSNIVSNKVVSNKTSNKVNTSNKFNTNTVTKKSSSGTGKGLPILMYHYFYDKNNPPKDKKLNSNYMEITDFENQMKYLHNAGFYFPTWQEVADFIDGKITLPSNSVVVTIDDGQKSFFDLAVPIIKKYNIRATSFIITSKNWSVSQISKYKDFITFESHTHDMHHGGCTGGHGGLFRCIAHDKGVADLNKSIQILGSKDAIAYPYGDVTDNTLSITKEVGFKVGVTTVNAKARKGMDKLQLPRVRMSRGVSLNTFKGML